MADCEICKKPDDKKAMCFRSERWCSDRHRKMIEGELPKEMLEHWSPMERASRLTIITPETAQKIVDVLGEIPGVLPGSLLSTQSEVVKRLKGEMGPNFTKLVDSISSEENTENIVAE